MNSEFPYKLRILKLVCLKLKQASDQNPKAQLHFAIIERAILDLAIKAGDSMSGSVRNWIDGKRCGITAEEATAIREDAISYLKSRLFNRDCHLAGLDPDYVDRIINTLLLKNKPIYKVAA